VKEMPIMPPFKLRASAAGFFCALLAIFQLSAQPVSQPFFLFDPPDETIQAALLENPNFYDAGIASSKEGLWLAWLEFQPLQQVSPHALSAGRESGSPRTKEILSDEASHLSNGAGGNPNPAG
jgi:hypothetical protein